MRNRFQAQIPKHFEAHTPTSIMLSSGCGCFSFKFYEPGDALTRLCSMNMKNTPVNPKYRLWKYSLRAESTIRPVHQRRHALRIFFSPHLISIAVSLSSRQEIPFLHALDMNNRKKQRRNPFNYTFSLITKRRRAREKACLLNSFGVRFPLCSCSLRASQTTRYFI